MTPNLLTAIIVGVMLTVIILDFLFSNESEP